MQKKIALVTGANRGIGFAVAKGLLQKGITVIASARTDEKAKVTKENLSSYGDIHVYPLEVTQLPSIQKAVQYVHNNFGQLDILINNAGVNYDTWHHVQNADLEEVRQTFETNTFAPWQLIQNFLPLLKKSKAGRIVNVSSGSGAFSSQNGQTPGYSLSKYALNGLTLQFAQALQRDGILVNAVCPGWVRTDMGGSGAPRSPEQGADTIIWAALLENSGPSGKFFRDRKEVSF
ncbi:MAG: SDR family oxidoreductase [Saprospiraceae bacterium]|nr:SDR family oxidoreductase [Saprospiraceae bacterium]